MHLGFQAGVTGKLLGSASGRTAGNVDASEQRIRGAVVDDRELAATAKPRRADAVVSALKIAGANANQMESISWGKEKPKAKGHDEAAWAENRRADLVYPTK